jgi:hypothetical protein
MIAFIGTSITTALYYNQLYQLTVDDCLRLAPFLAGLRVSSLPLWLCSDVRIGHLFIFRFPLVNTPQLKTELCYEYRMIELSHEWLNPWIHEWTLFYNSGRTEQRSWPRTVRVLHCYSVFIRCYETCLATCYPATEVLPLFDCLTSGTCLPNRCVAMVVFVTI